PGPLPPSPSLSRVLGSRRRAGRRPLRRGRRGRGPGAGGEREREREPARLPPGEASFEGERGRPLPRWTIRPSRVAADSAADRREFRRPGALPRCRPLGASVEDEGGQLRFDEIAPDSEKDLHEVPRRRLGRLGGLVTECPLPSLLKLFRTPVAEI